VVARGTHHLRHRGDVRGLRTVRHAGGARAVRGSGRPGHVCHLRDGPLHRRDLARQAGAHRGGRPRSAPSSETSVPARRRGAARLRASTSTTSSSAVPSPLRRWLRITLTPAMHRSVGAGDESLSHLGAAGGLSVGGLDGEAEQLLRRVELLPFAPLLGRAVLELVALRVAILDPRLAVAIAELAGSIALREGRRDLVEPGPRGIHRGEHRPSPFPAQPSTAAHWSGARRLR